jgi:sec-independent protein translocase protein TatA
MLKGEKYGRASYQRIWQSVAVALFVLFGGMKLPELGKGIGEGLRGFKDGMKVLPDELNQSAERSKAATPKAVLMGLGIFEPNGVIVFDQI